MALWQKIKQLDFTTLGDITTLYSANNIPIEVRDYFSAWIETSIKQLQPDAFVLGLRCQIQDKLMSIKCSSEGNCTITPFYVVQRLSEFESSLITLSSEDLQKRFLSCLEIERKIIKRQEERQMNSCCSFPILPTTSLPHVSAPSKKIHVPTINAGFGTLTEKLTDFTISRQCPSQQMQDPPVDPSLLECENFLNNPLRMIIDSEMNKILEGFWSLEEASNTFAFKCHEMKRFQYLLNEQRQRNAAGGAQQVQIYLEFQELETQLNEIRSEILQQATIICGQISEVRRRTPTVLQNWEQLNAALLVDIEKWTQDQRLHANGKPMTCNLTWIQHLAEYLMEVLWKLRHLLLACDKICQVNRSLTDAHSSRESYPDIPQQLSTISFFIKQLVRASFLISQNPNQVQKTNTRFYVAAGSSPMEVQLLVGEKLGLKLTPPSVSVSIVDERTCREIEMNGLEGDKFNIVSNKGKLIPDSARLEFNPETKRSSAIFRQICLKDFDRTPPRKNASGKEQMESVTEEKLCLLFRSEFTVGDLHFQVWKLSLPIVIITHGSQENAAWAVITWDNAFCEPRRIPFQVPEYASWTNIREMLNYRFTAIVGAPLTPRNLNYFADRLSKYPGFPDQLSWSELCKLNMPDREFPFWKWFYESAKLIEQHFKEAWKNGYVTGFIGKTESENALCNSGCFPGTFMFRISESTVGGISIVWLHSDGKAYSLNPFTSKDLANQPLVEKLDQDTLHFVYPNTRKEIAFKKYYDDYKSASKKDEPAKSEKRDYIRIRNQLVIDNPDIPKFQLARSWVSQQGHSTDISVGNASLTPQDETLVELDIDQIVKEISAMDHQLTSELTSTVPSSIHSPASYTATEREGPRSAASDAYIYSPPDQSFYVQL